MASVSSRQPSAKLARITVDVSSEIDPQGKSYILASKKNVKDEVEIQTYGAFWIEWKVENGLAIEGARARSGGEIRGFEKAANDKRASALVVLTEEEFTYHLCVADGSVGTGHGLRLAHGDVPSDGAARIDCTSVQLPVIDPQPPPKVIGPPRLVRASDANVGSDQRPRVVHVRIASMIWSDGTVYLQANAPARRRAQQAETIQFIMPQGFSFKTLTPTSGGMVQAGSGRPQGPRVYLVDVEFDAGTEFVYNLTLEDSDGTEHPVFGGRPCSDPDNAGAMVPPKPPPVIIGDP